MLPHPPERNLDLRGLEKEASDEIKTECEYC